MIRDARHSDVPAIAALAQQKRVQYAGYQMQFWNVAANAEQLHRPWLEKLVADDSVISLVADDNRAVCGYLFATIGKTPPVYDAGGDTASVDDFFVSPASEWTNTGRALLDAARARLSDQGIAQLVVVCGHLDGPKRGMLAEAGLSLASEWYVCDLRGPASSGEAAPSPNT